MDQIAQSRCADVTVLLGLKADLEDGRQVGTQEAEALAQRLGVRYMECSSKTGEGVEKPVSFLVRAVGNRLVDPVQTAIPAPTTSPNTGIGAGVLAWCRNLLAAHT